MLYQTLHEPKSAVPGRDSVQTAPRRLPEPWKTRAEAISKLTLDDVRIYYNSAKPSEHGALAYARKNEIHMGPGAAAHVPHELWHIVQQRQGRVSAHGTNPPANEDRMLEQEADAFEKGLLRPETMPAFPAGSSFSSEPVQYLKPLGRMSYLTSPDVRAALRAYHTFCNSYADENLLTRDFRDRLSRHLETVLNACEEGNPKHANLREQAEQEQEICGRLRGFTDKADNLAGLLAEEDAPFADYVRKLYYACKIVENYEDCEIPVIHRLYETAKQTVDHRDTLEQEQMLIRLHVTRFHMIQRDPNAPDELKAVLNQILPLTEGIPVRYGLGGKQTSLMKPNRGPFVPQYNYGPAGNAGDRSDLEISARRLDETIDTAHGGFLHELTHAAVQRTFHNTPMHLGFRAIPLTADNRDEIQREFERVLEYRSRTARRLNQLIQTERADAQSPFTKWQLNSLSHKLAYGACQPMLFQYLQSLGVIGENAREASLPWREGGELLFQITDPLMNPPQQQPQQDDFKIDSSIFMEYDTTINQMLLWCYDWEIPRDNPVYHGLAAAAQVEVNRRAPAPG